MSIISTLSVFLLSNPVATNALLRKDYYKEFFTGRKTPHDFWQEWAEVASLQHDSRRPRHVFVQRWRKFCEESVHILLSALDFVGNEYLCVRNRHLYIRSHEIFARWQNLRGRMSMQPVKFWVLHREGMHLRRTPVHPYSSCMADYIQREGLSECHLHLHACMPPEISWLEALNNLSAYEHHIMRFKKRNMQVLYTAVHPELTMTEMSRRMRLARLLRYELLSLNDENDAPRVVERMHQLYRDFVNDDGLAPAVIPACVHHVSGDELAQQELVLWETLFELVDKNIQDIEGILFFAHLYLLIQNDYLQLCRMNEANKGFEYFQVRAHYACLGTSLDVYYHNAFRQVLDRCSVTDKSCIEIRISPDIFCRMGVRLEKIWRECCAERAGVTPRFIVTIHFLKRASRVVVMHDNCVCVERYGGVRRRLEMECRRLVWYVEHISQLCDVGISIDGAGNEMQCPPDVMAPVFRLFERETGISYRTYHCGEDFYHLISGIRAVHEGLEFLELKQGNRIGHATAIGIPPDRWREDMPEMVVMRQGDWLLDLIFVRKLLLECNHMDILKIEQAMLHVAMKIFKRENTDLDVHVHSLSAFYSARCLDPKSLDFALDASSDDCWSPDPEEMHAMTFRKEWGICGLKLFRHWLYDRDSIAEQDKLVEVKRDFLNTEILLLLQQRVQKLINERDVVLEALPVSNVRISQYRDMRQHHILRWLGLKGHALPGDEVMTVCIGSDDPGIFVTDIKNEFYHIYANLRVLGLTPADCMSYIKLLNHAGRVYSFREKIVKNEAFEFVDWPTVAESMNSEPRGF